MAKDGFTVIVWFSTTAAATNRVNRKNLVWFDIAIRLLSHLGNSMTNMQPLVGGGHGEAVVPFRLELLRRLRNTGLLGAGDSVGSVLPFRATCRHGNKNTHAEVGSNNTRVTDPRTGIGALCAFTLTLSLAANATRIRGECRSDEAFVRKLKMFNAPFSSGGGDGGGMGSGDDDIARWSRRGKVATSKPKPGMCITSHPLFVASAVPQSRSGGSLTGKTQHSIPPVPMIKLLTSNSARGVTVGAKNGETLNVLISNMVVTVGT